MYWQKNHLILFVIQLVVLLLSVLVCVKLVLRVEGDKCGLVSEEEKHFMKLPTLDSYEERVRTDQFIDLEKGGLWLTDRQEVIFTGYLLGAFFAGILLVFIGAGPVYKWVRHIVVFITIGLVPYTIFIVTIGLWLALVCIILFIMGFLHVCFAPFFILYHLVLGIIQIVRRQGN